MTDQEVVVQNDEEELGIDYRFLDHPRSTYSREQKLTAATTYVNTGSLFHAAAVAGLDIETVREWKNRSVWWDEALEKVRKEKQGELDACITNAIHQSMGLLVNRMEEGDPYVKRDGTIGHVPIKFKDLAVGMAVLYDKRALIRGEATSIRKESQESLKTLENRFKEFALTLKEKDVVAQQ